jgi:hypothetical protein
MCRRRTIWVIVASATVALAACSSSGTHTQSYSPSPSSASSSSTSSSDPASTSASSTAPTSSGVPTPTVTRPAQAAVNAYIAQLNLTVAADRDPAHADLAAINRYLTGRALTLIDGEYTAMAKAGQAYRGTPATPRIKVQTVLSSTAVMLTTCPQFNRSDPYVEYYVATGKPVPVPTRNPPPPYLLTVFMKKVGTQWKVYDLLQNAGQTCHA